MVLSPSFSIKFAMPIERVFAEVVIMLLGNLFTKFIIHCLILKLTIFTICIRTDRPEQTVYVASHLGLHCLPLIQQFLDTTSGSDLYWFKF